MSDPSLLLQGALFALLQADGGVTALVGARIYDDVPPEEKRVRDTGNSFPYIVIGEDQVVGDDDDCGEFSQIISRIHVWSRAIGFPECKQICGAIRSAVRDAALTLAGFTVDEVQFEQEQLLKDPDGKTRHGVIEFRFLISHD